VARLRTRYNEFEEVMEITDEDSKVWRFDMGSAAGQHALCRHIETILARHEDYEPERFPLNLLTAPSFDQVHSHYRFMDSGKGFVSFLNLNSVRDLGQRIQADLDALRFRANVWVEDLVAFEDHDWTGKHIRMGDNGPEFEVLKPIERCVATHVNPESAARDVEVCAGLWTNYGHRNCGIYTRIIKGGLIRPGDRLHVY
jgi:uncharacterized protein YcbX